MSKVEPRPWDAANYSNTPRDMTDYLEAALEDGDGVMIPTVLDDIARA